MKSQKDIKKPTNEENTVDEASKESFPASDPPAWTTGTDENIEKKYPKPKDDDSKK